MSGPLHVLIADDHPIIRRGVRQILADGHDIAEVGEAATPQEVLSLARARRWDTVVLDIGLPGRGGLDVLKELKAEFPKLPVLILSMHPEEQYAVRALRAGAAGYLTKEAAPERLLEAIRRVAGGGRYISASLADRLAAELVVDTSRPRHETLSDREFDVFKRLGAGMTVSEIARVLSLSVKTVSGYRANILEKTGLANNAAIMKYVLDHELLDS
jgi:DNA-binding NarL/FixJ family response regulator